MKDKKEKSLIIVDRSNFFYKIRKFFYNWFKKEMQDKQKNQENINDKKEQFKKYVKNIEDEENKLLKLQKMYRNGDIKEEELTQIQIKKLCDLYDKQIRNLRKTNEYRKQKVLEYRYQMKRK